MSNISSWFDKNIHGGLDRYLVGISSDIESKEGEKVAKLKMEFVKLIEQVLCQLPQHQESVGQSIEIIVTGVDSDKTPDIASTTPDEIPEQ